MALESLHRRCVTHRNFIRADRNLKQRFRSADDAELAKLDDCCASAAPELKHPDLWVL